METKNFRLLDTYPLIVFKMGNEEYQLAEANIVLDSNQIRYLSEELNLEKEEKKIFYATLNKIIDSDPEQNIKKMNMKNFLRVSSSQLKKVSKQLNKKLTKYEEVKLGYLLYREYAGFGKIEPLLHDLNIKYIFCERPGLLLKVYHKNPKYGLLNTNIRFQSLHEFNNVVDNFKLKSKTMRSSPDFLGILDEDKLVQVSDVNNEFNINIISRLPILPKDIVKLKIATKRMMVYLNKIIKNRGSILVVGGNEHGRTELLNSLASLVKKGSKTLTFETYPRLVIPQTDLYQVMLSAYEKRSKTVIEDHLRKHPDFIIADNVTELGSIIKNIKNKCQTFVSLNAQTFDEAMNQLGEILPTSTISNLDVVLVTEQRADGWPMIKEIYEIHQYDSKSKKLIINPVFFWHKLRNKILVGKSKLLS